MTGGGISRELDLERWATRAALGVVAAYTILWLLAQMPSPKLDYDEYEMLVMGQEWQASYWKHPPLPPWLAEIAYEAFGRTRFGLAVLSVTSTTIALLLVWRLSRLVYGAQGALIALLLTLGCYYLMLPVVQWNHNTAQWPFWAGAILLYRKAVLDPKAWTWLLLGVVAWGVVSTKYTGVLLLAALVLHALLTPEGRRAFKTPGPYLAIVVMAALLLPQALYLLSVSSESLAFAFQRPAASGFGARLIAPIAFLGSQLAYVAPALLLLAIALLGRRSPMPSAKVIVPTAPTRFDRSLLLATFFLPLLIGTLALTTIAGRWGRTEAMGSMFIMLGPSLMALWAAIKPVPLGRITTAVAVTFVILPPLATVAYPLMVELLSDETPEPYVDYGPIAEIIAADWHALTGRQLSVIVANTLDGGKISAELPWRPSVMIDGRFSHAPWVTPERLREEGALVLWVVRETATCADPPRSPDLLDQPLTSLEPVALPEAHQLFCRAALLPSGAA